MRGGGVQPVARGGGGGGDGLLPRRAVRPRRWLDRFLASSLQVRSGAEKNRGGEGEGQGPHHHQKKTASHNHVIITVFLMDAQAVINKYHIKYKISRIYRPYNLWKKPEDDNHHIAGS